MDLGKRIMNFLDSSGNDARNNYGCSGAIAMNLTVCKKQVEKQWRQQVVMIIVHKFSCLKRVDLINV